jgi:hypothetical protein
VQKGHCKSRVSGKRMVGRVATNMSCCMATRGKVGERLLLPIPPIDRGEDLPAVISAVIRGIPDIAESLKPALLTHLDKIRRLRGVSRSLPLCYSGQAVLAGG